MFKGILKHFGYTHESDKPRVFVYKTEQIGTGKGSKMLFYYTDGTVVTEVQKDHDIDASPPNG